MRVSDDEIQLVLRDQFGHDQFLPGQERVVEDLLKRRDVLAVLPTGSGKSLVFQLVSQLLPGLTLVVSPLIALMKDQVDSIEERGLEVSLVNSTLTTEESREEMSRVQSRESRLLYITPERLQNEAFLEQLRKTRVSLFAVDEAHCVSEWGYDFRPAYLSLGRAAESLGRPTILALTATATPWVRRDIIERLGMRRPDIVVRTADRPNLFLETHRLLNESEEPRLLRSLLEGEVSHWPAELAEQMSSVMQGSGIIYTTTIRAAEETASWLRSWDIPADFYHGQRRKDDRNRVQDAFMTGETRVIAATSAFGLGVDKPDVRFVIHRHIPGSLEEYYQEAGRAGRDGNFARSILIYRSAALGRAAFFSASGKLSQADLERVCQVIEQTRNDAPESRLKASGISIRELAKAAGISQAKTTRLLELLEQVGAISRKGSRVLPLRSVSPDEISLESEEQRREFERSRVKMMRGYAETRECRRRYLLNYFGQELETAHCRMCDNDYLSGHNPSILPQGEPGAQDPEVGLDPGDNLDELLEAPDEGEDQNGRYYVGKRVIHETFGAGEVQRVTPETLTILFDNSGYKTLDAELVEKSNMLRSAGE